MMQITPQMRILVATEPADFRKGIDGLARVCREALCADPFSGTVFVFRNRGATAIKMLVYDGQGFWLCQKRLSQGRLRYWPGHGGGGRERELLAHELQVLLAGGDPEATRVAPQWRRLVPPVGSLSSGSLPCGRSAVSRRVAAG
ncbi:MAG: IS66 family insertion sequence element accessory protein TnpB [Candidatus Dormibacterales bacterium]